MSTVIKLYDEAKVSNRIKRLAFCFNLAAENVSSSSPRMIENAVKNGIDLYMATAGKTSLPEMMGNDDISYMNMQFLKMASKLLGRDSMGGWSSYTDELTQKAEQIKQAAQKSGLGFTSDLL